MRTLLVLLAAVALTGCVRHTQVAQAQLETQSRFTFVRVDSDFGYLIDPRTESCFLREAGGDYNFALTPVPCDKLKRNVPEAAPAITWLPDAPPPEGAPVSTPAP